MTGITIGEDAEQQIRNLSPQDRKVVIAAIECLRNLPGSKIEKLEDDPPLFRIGCDGGWKIVFTKDEGGNYKVLWVRSQDSAYAGLNEIQDGLGTKFLKAKLQLQSIANKGSRRPLLQLAS